MTRKRPAAETSDQKTIELIATVSHEIRSPLTTIKGFTKTLLDRWERLDDETKIEMLQAINEDADRVTRILTELLDVSRLEAGRLSLHLRPVDARELASEVLTTLAGRSESHELTLAPGGDVDLLGDLDKVRQVLTNLVENAQKYSDPGAISVSIEREGEEVVVSVADPGPGFPVDMTDRIFEKFARRDMPGAPTGTGLGLYICRGLVEAQGGSIGVHLASGRTTFWFRLPLAS